MSRQLQGSKEFPVMVVLQGFLIDQTHAYAGLLMRVKETYGIPADTLETLHG